MKCPVCKGTGVTYQKRWKISEKPYKKVCNFCKGEEDLDWIDLIFGVNKNEMSSMQK